MAHVRFSLRSLFGGVAFAAVACAALISASPLWASGLWTVTVALLLAALPLANFRDGRSRAFALGFLSFGWLYLAILVWPYNNRLVDSQNRFLPGQLATSRLTSLAYEKVLPLFRTPANSATSGSSWSNPVPSWGNTTPSMQPPGMGGPMGGGGQPPMGGMGAMSGGGGGMGMMGGGSMGPMGGGMMSGGSAGTITVSNYPTQNDFDSVGDALWTLIIAVCGGVFARYLYDTHRSPALNS